jgi:6-pyruvoyl-tetrahydropterin synthase
MNHNYTTARQVAAGHSLAGHPLCKHQHGHDWTIAVTVKGLPDIEAQVALAAKLDAFVDEIRGKNLNDLNPAGSASTSGLAMWAWERLVMTVPNLSSIEVSTSDERSRVSA